jgi:hypothetical protein
MKYLLNLIADIKAIIIINRYHNLVAKLSNRDFSVTHNEIFMRKLDRARSAYLELRTI